MFSLFKRNPKTTSGIAAVALAIGSLIVPWEGLETKAYKDIVGVWTVCYGETQGVKPGMTFTPQQCKEMLVSRVTKDYYEPLKSCIPGFENRPVELQAALISLTYNIGVGAACKSTAARRTREGKLEAACRAIPMFNKAGGRVVKGLENRRQAELALCLKGVK